MNRHLFNLALTLMLAAGGASYADTAKPVRDAKKSATVSLVGTQSNTYQERYNGYGIKVVRMLGADRVFHETACVSTIGAVKDAPVCLSQLVHLSEPQALCVSKNLLNYKPVKGLPATYVPRAAEFQLTGCF